MTTFSLLLTLARPLAARIWAWFLDGAETEVVSHRTGRRELREREQLRKAFLLADLDRKRREVMAS